MTMTFTDRLQRVEPSATLAISNRAAQLTADGVDVVDLSVGEPDFPTPENIVQAGKTALDNGYTGYAPSNGIPSLKEAIVEKLADDNLTYAPDEVIVTPGAKQALYETFQALVEDGDEVVLLDPAWVSYEAMAKMAGASLTRVDLSSHDFQLAPALDALAEAVSDETALVVVNSPSNPSGAVYTEAALEGVRDLAVDHEFTVIADEIYKSITYGATPPSLGSMDGMHERTVTINGFSKAYSMTGWRLGYLAAPTPLIEQAGKLHSHSVSCATHFVQYAGVEALQDTDEAVEEMRASFEERRDVVLELLAEEGIEIPVPDGAFYMMIPIDENCPGLADHDTDADEAVDQAWCEGAIDNAHVATVPGSAFGTPGYARISYAADKSRLQEGIERLTTSGYL